MSLASIFRAISLQVGGVPWTALPGGASGNLADRPNPAPRWKPVPGAASEPDCLPADFNSMDDARTENLVAS